MTINATLSASGNALAASMPAPLFQPVNSPLLNALLTVRSVPDVPPAALPSPPFSLEKVIDGIKNTGPNSTEAFFSERLAKALQTLETRQSWTNAVKNIFIPGHAEAMDEKYRTSLREYQICQDALHIQKLTHWPLTACEKVAELIPPEAARTPADYGYIARVMQKEAATPPRNAHDRPVGDAIKLALAAHDWKGKADAQPKAVAKRSLDAHITSPDGNRPIAKSGHVTQPVQPAHDELEHIRMRLASTTAYVHHADERITVHTALDALHALYKKHRHHLHSAEFHQAARVLLARYHLLGPALKLAQQLQDDSADATINAQPVKRSVHEDAFTRALKTIISSRKDTLYKQSQEAYFKEWQSTLTHEERWLQRAGEDAQRAVKTARDNFASADMRYQKAVAHVAVRQLAPVRDVLAKHGVASAPHNITLRATVAHPVGRYHISTQETVSLASAWLAGTLPDLLRAPDLRLYENGVRMQGENQQRLIGAMLALPPVESAQFFANPALSDAYHERLMARFDLVTLEADFKGEIQRDGHIKGLDIINAFRQGSDEVVAQRVAFSVNTLNGERLEYPLRGWLILENKAGGIVFFNADVDEPHHFFENKRALYAFISKRHLQHGVIAGDGEGRPPLAISAQLHAEKQHQFDIAHFLSRLKDKYNAWDSYQAKLTYTDIDDRDYYSVMRSFSHRLYDYHVANLDSSAELKRAAQNLVYAKKHWQHVTQRKLLNLNAFIAHHIKESKAFTQYLQDKNVLRGDKKFNPDKYFIKLYGNTATFTEYAKNMRRTQGNRINFARDAEIIPEKLFHYPFIEDMTPTTRREFHHKLRQELKSQTVPESDDEHIKYIASLSLIERKQLSHVLSLYFRLNKNDIRQGLDEALIGVYVGDEHEAYLRPLKDTNVAENKVLHDAFITQELASLKYAVLQQQAYNHLSPSETQRLMALINRYPDTSGTGDTLSPLMINGANISGMYVLTFTNRLDRHGQSIARQNYIYTREMFHGRNLFNEKTFMNLLKTDPQVSTTVENWALTKDKKAIHEGIGMINAGLLKIGAMPQKNFNLYQNMLDDRISNTAALTIGHAEVIKDQVVTGINTVLLPVCLAGGPVTMAPCLLTNVGLAVYNVIDAINESQQGDREAAAMSLMFSIADIAGAVNDVMDFIKVARQGIKAFNAMPGGMDNLMRLSQRTHFSSAAEVRAAKENVVRQRRFFHGNHLNQDLSVSVDLSTATPHPMGDKQSAVVWEMAGNYYIRDREYSDDAGLIYKVKFEQGGRRIRLIDPKRPHGPTEKIVWQGRWMKDHSGLLGGDSAYPLIKKAYPLQDNEIDVLVDNINNNILLHQAGYDNYLQVFTALEKNALPPNLKTWVDEQAAILIAQKDMNLNARAIKKLSRLLDSRKGIIPHHEKTAQALIALRKGAASLEQTELSKTLHVTLELSEAYQLGARQSYTMMQAIYAAFPRFTITEVNKKLLQLLKRPDEVSSELKKTITGIKNDILIKDFLSFDDVDLAIFKMELEQRPSILYPDEIIDGFIKNNLNAHDMSIFMTSKQETLNNLILTMSTTEKRKRIRTLDYTRSAVANYNADEIFALRRYKDYAFLPDFIKNEPRTLNNPASPLNTADEYFNLFDPSTKMRMDSQKLYAEIKPALDASFNRLAREYQDKIRDPSSPWHKIGIHAMTFGVNPPNHYHNTLQNMNVATPENVINDIFSVSDGLIIGELHNTIVSKKFISDNMHSLSHNNVNTIYLEGFAPEYLANDLARFNEKNVMSFRLNNFIEGIDKRHGNNGKAYNLDRIFQDVRIHNLNNPANKIRIVPIDAEVLVIDIHSRTLSGQVNMNPGNDFDQFQVRVAMGNYIMTKAIVEDAPQRHGGKYVALVGAAHVNSHSHSTGASAIGMAPALNVVGMNCEYSAGLQPDTFHVNPPDRGLGHFDVVFTSSVN